MYIMQSDATNVATIVKYMTEWRNLLGTGHALWKAGLGAKPWGEAVLMEWEGADSGVMGGVTVG